ncbi:MAG: molybdate ABC transporter substrate-binding protein [Actinomycetota bacterium]|nr:molybdate ABC transporter substrate-binding protein [Actinomycetota bacterium]
MRRSGLLLASALLLGLAGCGEDDEEQGGAELTVSAASSLTEAFERYGGETSIEERFSFTGSDDLAAQIRQGAPVDVFASADTSLPEALFEEGLVEEPEVFISNELVVAVSSDSNLRDTQVLRRRTGLTALSSPRGIDLVIGAEGVPVGEYTREILAKLPKAVEEGILANARSEEPDVKGIVAKLITGAADAGFVYASDVDASGGELTASKLPPELDPVVSYGVAAVSDSDNSAAAQAFIDGLLGGAGREALLDAGFLEPKGE